MKYNPTRFQAAVTNLCEHLNYENTAYDSPTNLQTDETALALHNKLHATELSELPTLLPNLTAREKRYLSLFCQHGEPDQRRKAVECLFLEPRRANHRTLWRAFSAYYAEETTDRLAEFMNSTESFQQHLQSSQRQIIAGRNVELHAGLQRFWNHCLHHKQAFLDTLVSHEISPGSQFSTHAADHFLTYGSPNLWKLQGLPTLVDFYNDASDEIKIEAARQCHENYKDLPLNRARTNRFVDFFINELPGKSPQILSVLYTTQYQTWRWFKRFIGWNHAIDFFKRSKDTDNSRIEFWEEYFEHLYDAEHDQEQCILLLFFEHIGVVEFEKVGNAAYIYELPIFKALARDYTTKKDLKNTSQKHERIIHRGNWQSSARVQVLRAITTGKLSSK